MARQIQIYKGRGLWAKLLGRLKELEESKHLQERLITHSLVREKVCRNFCITKREYSDLMLFLADLGFIRWTKKGIVLTFEVKNG